MIQFFSKRRLRELALVAIATSLAGCTGLTERARSADYRKVAQQEPIQLYAQELEVLEATNRYRKAQGLPALEMDTRLVLIARSRSQDMARRSYFSHVTPDGSDVFQIMRAEKLIYQAAGENLARNNHELANTAQVAMQGWIKSPGHRANLVHPAFGRIGVGLALAKDGKKYFTQVFTD